MAQSLMPSSVRIIGVVLLLITASLLTLAFLDREPALSEWHEAIAGFQQSVDVPKQWRGVDLFWHSRSLPNGSPVTVYHANNNSGIHVHRWMLTSVVVDQVIMTKRSRFDYFEFRVLTSENPGVLSWLFLDGKLGEKPEPRSIDYHTIRFSVEVADIQSALHRLGFEVAQAPGPDKPIH